ncbi:VOC family protein [Brachybacterium sp. FME24]|uniref:VOC family protein n=1 Tax=Brachybacterium sp. FME24 TaxID=2742605 RepID=UPI0018691CB4|nr:VOC family protein [Brachybacterium sp. FME24]
MTEHTVPAQPDTSSERSTTEPAAFTVFPLRFTADPAALITFLRTLGMAPLITTEGDGFADLVAGGGGRVMVHAAGAASATGAPAGETQLSMAVTAAGSAAEQLRSAGLEVAVWDESYGLQGNITGPHGEAIGINEDQEDHYGYLAHSGAGADERLSVTAVRASADGPQRECDVEFFGALGFTPVDEGNHWYRALANPGHGAIGLHEPADGEAAHRPGGDPGHPELQVSLVRIGFETTEDLEALAERLSAAGYPARVVARDGVRSVHVSDPDGEHVEIHSRSWR